MEGTVKTAFDGAKKPSTSSVRAIYSPGVSMLIANHAEGVVYWVGPRAESVGTLIHTAVH